MARALVRFDCVQCVFFCHDETRYCLFLPGIAHGEWLRPGRTMGERVALLAAGS